MNKLLVTDIDGTITHLPHHLDSQVVDALHRLHDTGWNLFFLTGRYFAYAHSLFEKFAIPYLLGCQNGACVWSSEKKTFLYSRSIPHEFLHLLAQYTEDARVAVAIESGAQYDDHYYRAFLGRSDDELRFLLDPVYFPNSREKKRLRETHSLVNDYPYATFAAVKIFGKKEEVEKIADRFTSSAAIMRHVSATLMRWPFDEDYRILFMTDKSVSKGSAVDRVVDLVYEGQRPFVMASGDDANDIDLIKSADFKIVMNSAPEAMHGLADFLAPPAKKLGIISAWEAGLTRYSEITDS
ncbi:HAD hydrolase, IIB family protein [Chlamydia ibidis]|uniref:HAD hydrolase, IIB family protein n=2 Tax=Chlamydia ibidis TaxID=1405396 RepID=S7J469_9CHLA|nr:HAD family hydrolase [Chlamydia ibidis]EPP35028.1 HAD hydrolase, IIB family protein [Chlamydia ibidis]EQM62706.1 HAD hydrolase, IIB family protein [Chlamydia ibidis 10-1398/6]